MPAGPGGSHATVGWMRFHGMTTQAAADKTRAANAAKLIEWFGGKADGQYQFQKMLFTDIGSGFGVKELFKDPEIQANYQKYSDIAMFEKQQQLAPQEGRDRAAGSASGTRSTARPGSRRSSARARRRTR